jgi:hypothetical protein
MTLISELQSWYIRQCDGEWEHQHGISIESCDNPGWWVKVALAGTALENIVFEPIRENVDAAGFQQESRWLSCRVDGKTWQGAGDETKLERIIQIFLAWAAKHSV